MTADTPAQAFSDFLEPLQRAISCVSVAVLNVRGGYYVSARPHYLTLQDSRPVPLGRTGSLLLSIDANYLVLQSQTRARGYEVRISAYKYSLYVVSSQELVSYHWHPQGESWARFPHMHLGPAAGVSYEPFQQAHIPTGHVALQDILRLAITELGVEPLRSDWATVLDETRSV